MVNLCAPANGFIWTRIKCFDVCRSLLLKHQKVSQPILWLPWETKSIFISIYFLRILFNKAGEMCFDDDRNGCKFLCGIYIALTVTQTHCSRLLGLCTLEIVAHLKLWFWHATDIRMTNRIDLTLFLAGTESRSHFCFEVISSVWINIWFYSMFALFFSVSKENAYTSIHR